MIEWLGYALYTVSKDDRLRLLNCTLKNGLVLYGEQEREACISFRVPLTHVSHMDAAFREAEIPYQKSKPRGLLGTVWKWLKHPSVAVGVVLSLLVYFFLTNMIWEVRIISPGEVDEDAVTETLLSCGLYEGAFWRSIDPDEVSANLLLTDSDIAFASVHLEGMVARVELIPKTVPTPPLEDREPSHVVAAMDAQIRDIRVYRGDAVVKVGETVKAGDLLVSGVVTNTGGTRLVAAKAEVLGLLETTLKVTVPYEERITRVTGTQRCGFSLTVFGRTFRFGNTSHMEDTKRLYLANRIRLPIAVTAYYTPVTLWGTVSYKEEEMTAMATYQMREKWEQTVGEGNLITKDLSGKFTENGYELTCHLVYETNIGKNLAFSVNNQ